MEGCQGIRFNLFERQSRLRYLVTERHPTLPLDFSLALHTGQDRQRISDNRRRLERCFGTDAYLIDLRQVHGDRVIRVDAAHRGEVPEADALITDRPGLILTILTADCVPLLLYDPVYEVIAAVHAGWRGCEKRIVQKTIMAMRDHYGSPPETLRVAVGPSIDACCYEVGPEVAYRFEDYPGAIDRRGGKWTLNLKRVCLLQLLEAGVPERGIEITPHCTACEKERFFSYRAEQQCDGRFASCIMLTP